MTANSFDWDDELPPETEEEVYRALLRALRRKQGFGLFFVQCSKAQGEKVVADLRQDLPQQRIQELHLQGEVVTLYDQIDALWQQQPFDVLAIEGLQASLYAYEDAKRFGSWSSDEIYSYSWKGVPKLLNHLNQQREHLRDDFPARFVFFVPRFVVDYFIQRAADFLDWRSGLFRFPDDLEEIKQDIGRFVAEGGHTRYLNLPPQGRIEKILELKSLQEICTDSESKTKILLELGVLFDVEQDYGNAITSYDKALEFKPDFRAWNNRGLALFKLGRQEEAIANYDKALEVKPDDYYAWYNRGYTLSALGRSEEAIASFDKALEFKPDNYDAWLMQGVVMSALGHKEVAIASYDKALEFKPDYHGAWNNRGIVLSDLGRKEEAIASYDKALEFKPDYHGAWYNRGNALSKLGRYEEAIESYDKALESKTDYHEAWYARGRVLSALGHEEVAIASYDKALESKPDYHEAWNNRGNMLYKLGRYEEAIASYNKALELKPNFEVAWFNKARCHGLQKKIDLAIETLQHAITLDSKCRELAKTNSAFDGIRDSDRFRELIGE
jgi:tetratricopeptide (TPR) repeat protein